MDNKNWERIGAATGIAYAALGVIAFFLVAQPPKIDAPIANQVAYFASHRTGILWQCYLFGLSTFALLWFAGSVRHALWKAEGDTGRLANIAYGGAIAASALFLGGMGLRMTLAYNLAVIPQIGAAATVTLYSVSTVALTLAWFPVAVFVGATSLVVLRNRALPSMIGVLGIPLTIGLVAAGGTLRTSGAAAPGGTLTSLAMLVFLAWTLATSATMVARIGTKVEPRTIYLEMPERERLRDQELHRTAS